mgnify:CR=1 FL=1
MENKGLIGMIGGAVILWGCIGIYSLSQLPEKERREQIERQYQSNKTLVFMPNGYADLNGDRALSPEEIMQTYSEMGINYRVDVVPEREPTQEELTKFMKDHRGIMDRWSGVGE